MPREMVLDAKATPRELASIDIVPKQVVLEFDVTPEAACQGVIKEMWVQWQATSGRLQGNITIMSED